MKKITQKVRKHSGRKTPGIIFDGMKKEEIINNCLEPQEYWDDWDDYRDGIRGCNDRKQLRNQFMIFNKQFEVRRWNKKLKDLIWRRKTIKKIRRIKWEEFTI